MARPDPDDIVAYALAALREVRGEMDRTRGDDRRRVEAALEHVRDAVEALEKG